LQERPVAGQKKAEETKKGEEREEKVRKNQWRWDLQRTKGIW
jgi:hypothetical protein